MLRMVVVRRKLLLSEWWRIVEVKMSQYWKRLD